MTKPEKCRLSSSFPYFKKGETNSCLAPWCGTVKMLVIRIRNFQKLKMRSGPNFRNPDPNLTVKIFNGQTVSVRHVIFYRLFVITRFCRFVNFIVTGDLSGFLI